MLFKDTLSTVIRPIFVCKHMLADDSYQPAQTELTVYIMTKKPAGFRKSSDELNHMRSSTAATQESKATELNPQSRKTGSQEPEHTQECKS